MNKPGTPYVPPAGLSDQVDQYLQFKAEVSALEAKIDALKPHLTSYGVAELTGSKGTITVDQVNGRKTTDWKTVAAVAKVPQALIDKNTKVGDASYRIVIKYTQF